MGSLIGIGLVHSVCRPEESSKRPRSNQRKSLARRQFPYRNISLDTYTVRTYYPPVSRQTGRTEGEEMGEFWYCEACGAQNHKIDGTCQYCECPGSDATCKRGNCDGPHKEWAEAD